MNEISFVWASLKSRALSCALSIFLTAFGVMLAVLILQFGHHIQNRLTSDGQGIHVVVGAKGSPLQLVLSSVFHIDMPTGNIPYDVAQKWMKHPQVKKAIPLALGDNWRGFRIVGTTTAYMDHYGAKISEGRTWNKPFEAVAGSSLGLSVGAEFTGAHGLMEGGHEHEKEKYKIVGTLSPTGTVLDRLILTSLDSVLKIHGLEGIEHTEHSHHEEYDAHDHAHHDDHETAGEPEITALLLTTKSPVASINLPRSINRESQLQAASPAIEMARLTAALGLGSKSFSLLSGLLIIIAALSIFAGLAGSLENRMADLAVLRALGYSKARLMRLIVAEGMIIVMTGMGLGLLMGLGAYSFLSDIIAPLSASRSGVHFTSGMIWLSLGILLTGLLASAIPGMRAARANPVTLLSGHG